MGRNPFIIFKYKPSASSMAAELKDVACFTGNVMQDVHEQRTGTDSASARHPALEPAKQPEFSTCLAGRAGMTKLESNRTGASCSGCWSHVARHCVGHHHMARQPRQGCLLALPVQDTSCCWAGGCRCSGACHKSLICRVMEERGGIACPGPELGFLPLHLNPNALGRAGGS